MSLMPIRGFPALLLRKESERVLVISDLHIGWEAALAQKGIHIPSQTSKILEKIAQLVKVNKPSTVLFLGDVKHTIAKAETEEWRDIPNFFEKMGEMVQDIRIVPGNHDGNLEPLLPESVTLLPSHGIVFFRDIGLLHGHTWPAPELLECRNLIIGHVHPTVAFRDPLGFRVTRQVWVKAKGNRVRLAKSVFNHLKIKAEFEEHALLKRNSLQLHIMPSFNELLGGQIMNKKRVEKSIKMRSGPILHSKIVDINNAELYLLDGTLLGSVTHLRTMA